jgi:hypothetical protein
MTTDATRTEAPVAFPVRRIVFFLFLLSMVLVLVSIGFIFLFSPAAKQARAFQRVLNAGGSVTYDARRSPWLFRRFGFSKYAAKVYAISFSGNPSRRDEPNQPALISDWGLRNLREELKALTELETLDLSSTPVSDVGLEYLQDLSRLERLDLSDTKVTDAGLEQLRGLTNLRLLDLSGTAVTDEAAAELRESLPKLNVETIDWDYHGPLKQKKAAAKLP